MIRYRTALCVLLANVAVLAHGHAAFAAWTAQAAGAGAAKARVMPVGNEPSASVSNQSVTLSWSPSSFEDGPAVSGYVVKRYSTDGAAQTVGSGCSGTIGGLGCTETSVPPGAWRYSVTPTQGPWTGTESAQSATVTVTAPSLSLSPTTVTSLPSALSGSISNFAPGQTVTFRLDDPTSGTVLSGETTPSPVPEDGSASVSVTLPEGTANGTHTVYAIGSGGDTATASITVAVPTFVKSIGVATCGATSLGVTVPAGGVAVGETLILRLALRGTSDGTVAASDSQGNPYSVGHSVLNGDQRVVILHTRLSNALTSGNTITVNFPSSTGSVLAADEFSGIAANPVDATGSGTGIGLLPSASVTTTNAPDLLVGAVSFAADATITQQPDGWTPLTGQSGNCSAAITGMGAHRVAATAGTFTHDPVVSNTGAWAATVVAFKAG